MANGVLMLPPADAALCAVSPAQALQSMNAATLSVSEAILTRGYKGVSSPYARNWGRLAEKLSTAGGHTLQS